MGLKKILLIVVFLFIFVWLFGKNIPIIRAQTMEELSTQIATLKNQIAEYQKEIAELQTKISTFRNEIIKLQAEIAKLLAKQISIVQNQIAQLQAKLLAKPETEYKCPDINGDGIVDISDMVSISANLNSCKGATNYNEKADLDGNGCLTDNDLNFLKKYYGKNTTGITQCKGVVITPTLSVTLSANPSSGIVPLNGVDLTANVSGTATGLINYTFYCNRSDTETNVTTGWCLKKDGITQISYTAIDCCNFSSAGTYTAKIIVERGIFQAEARINIQVNPLKPESEYKCPDLNRDGEVDIDDVIIISANLNSCQGAANFNEKADLDGNGCLTNTDLNFVQKYYGKKTEEIPQCKEKATLEYMEMMVASIIDAISQLTKKIEELQR